jgi:hypothetical protein
MVPTTSVLMAGDGVLVARVTNFSTSGSGGIVMRESLSPDATAVFAFFNNNYGTDISFDWKSTTGGSYGYTNQGSSLPLWFKVARSGNVFSVYTSPDGAPWTQFGTNQTIVMAQTIYDLLSGWGGGTSLQTFTISPQDPRKFPGTPSFPVIVQLPSGPNVRHKILDPSVTFTTASSGIVSMETALGGCHIILRHKLHKL